MTGNRFRNQRVELRLSDEEKEFFDTLFKNSGKKTRGAFIIDMLRNGKIINVTLQDDQLNEMHFKISQIGNNINQIARRINSTDSIYKEDIDELLEIKKQVEDIRTSFRSICHHFHVKRV